MICRFPPDPSVREDESVTRPAAPPPAAPPSPARAAPVPASVTSIQVGQPRPLVTPSGPITSAFVKHPVAGPVALRTLGLDGDSQVSTRYHGGPDRALCVYPGEHYAHWSERLERSLPPAAFGENFTTHGLIEDEVEIGATYAVGGAVVQVSQPREPCYKLAGRHGVGQLAAWVKRSGCTGFYLRVLQDGNVCPGEAMLLVARPATGVTVAEINRVAYRDRRDLDGLERAAAAEGLEAGWRRRLERLQRKAEAAR